MDMIAIYSFFGTIAGSVLYEAIRNRNVKVEKFKKTSKRLNEFWRFGKLHDDMVAFYPASQFISPSIQEIYIYHVLRNGKPYPEPWYTTMVRILALLDELRDGKFLHPYPDTVIMESGAIAITQVDLIWITDNAYYKARTGNNLHLMLAMWLLFLGLMDDFQEMPNVNFPKEFGGDAVPGRILSVAKYWLRDLQDNDSVSVIKMICDIWNNRSDFINMVDILEDAKESQSGFSSLLIRTDESKTVKSDPIRYIPSRFVLTFDTMENHLKLKKA